MSMKNEKWSATELSEYRKWIYTGAEEDFDFSKDDGLSSWQEKIWLEAYRLGIANTAKGETE